GAGAVRCGGRDRRRAGGRRTPPAGARRGAARARTRAASGGAARRPAGRASGAPLRALPRRRNRPHSGLGSSLAKKMFDSARLTRVPGWGREGHMAPLRPRVILVLAVLLLLPCRAGAQCTTRADASAVSRSAKLLKKCDDRRLRSGPGA